MVDIVALGVAVFVVAAVMIRRTSAGVGILTLFAGLMLDQLLSSWIIDLLPKQTTSLSEYIPIVVRLLITFTPMVITLVAVKVSKHNVILSILASLVLGFLVTYFGLKILAPFPQIALATKNSGLLTFLSPYQTVILASGTVLALVEMTLSYRSSLSAEKNKKK